MALRFWASRTRRGVQRLLCAAVALAIGTPVSAQTNDVFRLLDELTRDRRDGTIIRRLRPDEVIELERSQKKTRKERQREQQATRKAQTTNAKGNPVVKRLQQFLIEKNFDPGPADGDWGKKTERALAAWQGSIGDEPSGVLTDPQRIIIFGTADTAGVRAAAEAAVSQPQPSRKTTKTTEEVNPAPNPAEAGSASVGAWYGRISCQWDRETVDGQIEFDIANRADGYYELTLALYWPNNTDGDVSMTIFLGEDVKGKDGVRNFVVSKRANGISGLKPGNFTLTGDIGGNETLNAAFSNGPCPSFTAGRSSTLDQRLAKTTAVPADGGQYWALSRWRDKCEAVIAWIDKVTVEYPQHDFLKYDEDNHRRTLPLFADDDFMPVFGQAYDETTDETRRSIWDEIGRQCERDPFTRDRMQIYRSLIEERFREDGDDFIARGFALREIRKIRNEVRSLSENASNVATDARPFAAVSADLASILQQISSKSGMLWPSETKRATGAIQARIEQLARAEADKALAAVKAAGDARAGVRLASAALSDLPRSFLTQMSAKDRDWFKGAIAELQDGFARQLFEPELAKAASAPRDIAGIRQISAQMKAAPTLATGLPDTHKQKLVTALTAERDTRLTELAGRRIADFKAFPAGLDGLTMGIKWSEQLASEFAGYIENTAVRNAEAEFVKDRLRRLREALPEFEERARSMSGDEAKSLADQYLAMPRDKRQTVWLEYMFIANGAGAAPG